jgi:Holliday junction resolvase RusA-like endonuclease
VKTRVAITVDGKPSRWQRPGQGIDPRTGRAMRFTDPEAEAGKERIAWAAKQAFGSQRPFTGPVLVRVIGIFEIPPSWPKALIAAAKQARVMHVADPDLDQIVKQAKDALKGIAYVDDNQVVGYPNSAKRYGYPQRTEITVEALPQRPDEITPGQRRLEKRIETEGWDAVLAPPAKRKVSEPVSKPLKGTVAPVSNPTKSVRKPKYDAKTRALIDAALLRDGRR